ncbi:oxidoreductase 2OG-Fe(II) oxygenase family [Fusarium beomiforme]|uniref:Oxidoreductase 2OG-Fe(II) oxygenase family n=1 Tax=Fusarium beomiforme TaxID=44412 RepID=A0A9P5AHS8_9HYPO|nr:oxidoreductase 2OG-Fe(II) oxygenase family [Fusarium beomiforme]
MHDLIGAGLSQVRKTGNLNYRLCDYNMDSADPTSDNGCGAHTDYGTFAIIFQDGASGLEIKDAQQPGLWVPVPGDATAVLAGCCDVILSGGNIRATRHREVMGKKWRRREGNEKSDGGDDTETPDSEIERFIWA